MTTCVYPHPVSPSLPLSLHTHALSQHAHTYFWLLQHGSPPVSRPGLADYQNGGLWESTPLESTGWRGFFFLPKTGGKERRKSLHLEIFIRDWKHNEAETRPGDLTRTAHLNFFIMLACLFSPFPSLSHQKAAVFRMNHQTLTTIRLCDQGVKVQRSFGPRGGI